MDPSRRVGGLAALDDQPLPPLLAAQLMKWAAESRGSPSWRRRKSAELADLLKLVDLAPRLTLERVSVVTDLRAVVRMQCAVPRLPDPEGELVVAREAVLGLIYPEEAIRSPQPGYAFVEILEPSDVWLAVVPATGPQRLCLGASLPVGLPLREIVLAAYGALTMQNFLIDERDPAGVMNRKAALWWQQRTDLIPLSRVPFLQEAES
jgi:hypothetical protein